MKRMIVILTGILLLATVAACSNKTKSTSDSFQENSDNEKLTKNAETSENDAHHIAINSDTYNTDWSDISNGQLNEESFIQKLDEDILKEVATELQSLVDEEISEEKENPDIIITEGYTRVFSKEQYLNVLAMGEKAEMSLYYILYKSENNSIYEHICATALSELTGLKFVNESGDYLDWSTGKEYLELFNQYMSNYGYN